MGQGYSLFEANTETVQENPLGSMTAYAVPDSIHLNASQIVELRDERITQGVPFMLNEGGTYRPSGKKSKLNMIDSAATLHKSSVVAKFNKRSGGSLEFKYDAIYDTVLTIGVRHIGVEDIAKADDGSSLLSATSCFGMDYHRLGQYLLPPGIGCQFDSGLLHGYRHMPFGGDTTTSMSTIYTGDTNHVKMNPLSAKDYLKVFRKIAHSMKPSSKKGAQIVIFLEPKLPEPVIYTMTKSKNRKGSVEEVSSRGDVSNYSGNSDSLFGSVAKLLNPYKVLVSNTSSVDDLGDDLRRKRGRISGVEIDEPTSEIYSDSFVTRECSFLCISEIKKEELESISHTNISFSCPKQTITIDKDESKQYTYAPLFGMCIDKIGSAADSNDTSDCSICLSEPREFACLPCRHLSMCSTCVKDLAANHYKCPICRNPAQLFLK